MTKAWPFALALLLGTSPAAADCGDGSALACEGSANCEGGADAQCGASMQPDEDDPGGCGCWWGDGSLDTAAAIALFAPIALVIRRRQRHG